MPENRVPLKVLKLKVVYSSEKTCLGKNGNEHYRERGKKNTSEMQALRRCFFRCD